MYLVAAVRLAGRGALVAAVAISVAAVASSPALPIPPAGLPIGDRSTVTGPELLGEAQIPTRTTFDGTVVGGLSGISYDPLTDEYVLLSDDRAGARTRSPRTVPSASTERRQPVEHRRLRTGSRRRAPDRLRGRAGPGDAGPAGRLRHERPGRAARPRRRRNPSGVGAGVRHRGRQRRVALRGPYRCSGRCHHLRGLERPRTRSDGEQGPRPGPHRARHPPRQPGGDDVRAGATGRPTDAPDGLRQQLQHDPGDAVPGLRRGDRQRASRRTGPRDVTGARRRGPPPRGRTARRLRRCGVLDRPGLAAPKPA